MCIIVLIHNKQLLNKASIKYNIVLVTIIKKVLQKYHSFGVPDTAGDTLVYIHHQTHETTLSLYKGNKYPPSKS